MTVLALGSLLLIVYTYAGYPALVGLWARLAPLLVSDRPDFEPTVSVCLAVHDGADYIARKLESLEALDYPAEKLEFLIFSDGSTDRTDSVVRTFAAEDPRVRLLSSPERLGKPNALNRMRQEACGDILLLCDVRQPLDSNAARALVSKLADPRVGCVSGSLVLAGATGAGLYWKYERFIRTSESELGAMVGVSGSIYAVRRVDMPELPRDLLVDDMFVPLRLALDSGKHIVQAESALAFDDACDDGREFLRKVRTLAGNYQLFAKLPALLVPGMSPVWFPMISHKLLRLVCPWALVVFFGASFFLALESSANSAVGVLWRSVGLAEIGFGALAALGAHAGRTGAVARTFLVLNAAAVVGLWRFLRRSQAVTW